jgi:hypothetical protein
VGWEGADWIYLMCVLIKGTENWGTTKCGEYLSVCVQERLCAAWNWLVSWLLMWEFSYLSEDTALCA